MTWRTLVGGVVLVASQVQPVAAPVQPSTLHFSGELSLGNLAIVVTLIGIAVKIGVRLGSVQRTVEGHSDMLARHAERLDRYEATMIQTGQHLQRLIGRLESTQDRIDKRTGVRYTDRTSEEG